MKTVAGNKTTNGWDKVRIGDALRLINGRAFKPSEWRQRGLPIVRIQNLNNAEAPFNYYDGDLPEKFLLDNGDLLFAWSGTPGTSFGAHIWRGGKAWLNQHIFKVMFDEVDFNKKFLQLAINQNLNEYIRAAHGGAGLAHITKGRFEQSELVKPTLDEQRDIVAEIEKQFSRLDEAVANLKRVKANLKRYKASVLKAAVEGKLTEAWRKQHPNIEPASKLLERILAERRKTWSGKRQFMEVAEPDQMDLPALEGGWTYATVGQLGIIGEQAALTGPFGTNLGREDFREAGVPVLTISCLKDAGINLTKAEFVSKEKARELDRYRLKEGDLLFSRMAAVGRAGIVTQTLRGALFNYHIMRLRLEPTVLMAKYYLAYVRGSAQVENYIRKVNHGATRDGINTEQLINMPVALPPYAEQQEIVAEVERRLSVIEELESAVEANLKRADCLRQSILAAAFSGRLLSEQGNEMQTHYRNS